MSKHRIVKRTLGDGSVSYMPQTVHLFGLVKFNMSEAYMKMTEYQARKVIEEARAQHVVKTEVIEI